MKIDLHSHSVHSDGSLSIKELLNYADEQNITYLAITDHDTFGGVREVFAINEPRKVKIITGIELSTISKGESVHILGYFSKGIPNSIDDYIAQQKIARYNRMDQYVSNLNRKYDFDISFEELVKNKAVISRAHLCEAIIEKCGHLKRIEIYDKYLNEDNDCYVSSTKLSTKEAVKMLKKAGAVVVLAHPVLLKINEVSDIIEMGIDGIEAFYPLNSEQDTANYIELAIQNNLLVTGGSDFHRYDDYRHGQLGSIYFPVEFAQSFIRRLYDVHDKE